LAGIGLGGGKTGGEVGTRAGAEIAEEGAKLLSLTASSRWVGEFSSAEFSVAEFTAAEFSAVESEFFAVSGIGSRLGLR